MSTANTLANRNTLTHDEWLQLRTQGIGGSDAAAILGLSPYQSPYGLWREKTGQITDDETDDERQLAAMDRGRRLEPVIADWFADETGWTVRRCNLVLQHPEHPWMIANIDREIVGHDEGPGILECKNPGWRVVRGWEGDYPPSYWTQVQHYLAVRGWGWAALAMLVDGEFTWHHIERDDVYIDWLIDQEAAFWEHVQTASPPDVDGHPATAEALAVMFGQATEGKVVDLPDEARDVLKERARAKDELDAAKQAKTGAENRLKAWLGDAEVGLLDGVPAFRWTEVTSRRFDGKRFAADHPDLDEQYRSESTYRRIHVPKGVVDDG